MRHLATGGSCQPRRRASTPSSGRVQKQQQQKQLIQLTLDAGQRNIGMTNCTSCGMVYSIGNAADAQRHARYHAGRVASDQKRRKSLGGGSCSWTGQRPVKEFFNGDKIVRVDPSDKNGWGRALAAFADMEAELGNGCCCTAASKDYTHNSLVLLYIRYGFGIAGCCIAEPIRSAYRLLPPQSAKTQSQDDEDDAADAVAFERSGSPQAAQIGIVKIWCRAAQRRCGIATALLDCARLQLCAGFELQKQFMAFTAPTPSGYRLIAAYCATDCPLVY